MSPGERFTWPKVHQAKIHGNAEVRRASGNLNRTCSHSNISASVKSKTGWLARLFKSPIPHRVSSCSPPPASPPPHTHHPGGVPFPFRPANPPAFRFSARPPVATGVFPTMFPTTISGVRNKNARLTTLSVSPR